MPENTMTAAKEGPARTAPAGQALEAQGANAARPPLSERSRRIRQLAADRLGAPWHVCFRRACRRNRHCGTWDRAIDGPACIWNMAVEDRDLFFDMSAIAEEFERMLQLGTLADWRRNRDDIKIDGLQLASLEINDMLAPGDPRRLAEFRDFWRREAKMRVPSRKDTHSGNGTGISEAAHLSSST